MRDTQSALLYQLQPSEQYIAITKCNFGSVWPLKSMGAFKSFIDYTDITDNKHDMAFHGNACRLLGVDSQSLVPYDDNDCLFDTIASNCDRGIIDFLVEKVGADKVLFGSDLPMRDPPPSWGRVCYARIP